MYRELRVRAGRVAELSAKMVALAEALDEAQRIVIDVNQELTELGYADEVADELAMLVIPNHAAELLQDQLDQLAGELWNEACRGAAASAPPRLSASLLELCAEPRPREPGKERLMVRCVSCGEHVACGLVLSEPAFEKTVLDDQSYTCPSCGSEAMYETYDHFLE